MPTVSVSIDAHCPECGCHFEIHEQPFDRDARQSAGDFTICARCVAVLKFFARADGQLDLRLSTLAERNEAPPDLLLYVRAMTIVNAGRGGTG